MGCLSSKHAAPCSARSRTAQGKTGDGRKLPWGAASSSRGGTMGKARAVLAELMLLKGPDGPSKAADIILKHLGCGNVSIIAATSRPDLFIRLSAQGMFPARSYHRSQVLLSSDACAAGLFKQAAGAGSGPVPAVVYRSVKSADEAANLLPKDWEQEYCCSSMRTFLAVPIVAHSSEPMLGVLTLASCQPDAFWESWWEPLLGIVAVGLVPLLQERVTVGLVEVAMRVLSTATVCDFMAAVLQHTSQLLESIYHRTMAVRVALLSPDHKSLLLVLPAQSASGRDGHSGMTISCGSLAEELHILHLPTANTLMLEALSMGQPRVVRNTAKFLEEAQEPAKDVFVGADDVVASIATAPLLAPCRSHSSKGGISHGRGIADVGYSSSGDGPSSSSISSISSSRGGGNSGASRPHHSSRAHSPSQQQQRTGSGSSTGRSTHEAQWYGCLYVAHQSPCSFEAELPAITALSKMLTALMTQCMPASMAWRELSDLRQAKQSMRHSSNSSDSSTVLSSTMLSRASSQGCSPAQHRPASDSPVLELPLPLAGAPAPAGPSAGGGHQLMHIRRSSSLDAGLKPLAPVPASPVSASSAPLASQCPIATSSIVETLRRQVQHSRDRCLRPDQASYVQELQLQHLIGKGGFGTVYSGTWQGSPVAFKVMYVTLHERQLMKSAMEMAVLTSIQHPNIVRVYACLTDLVEEAGPMQDPGSNPLLAVHYRPVAGRDERCLPHTLCNIVVMEYLDRGNLHQALRHGLLHKHLPNKGLVVDMRLLTTILLQVAHSLQHLHEHGVIHSDVKCENVLLASSSSSPIGFVCKLGDFGLARLLLGNMYILNRSGSGTIAYQAPEVFVEGSRLTPALDVYAFGIIMYELYCCRRPYTGQAKDHIAKRVYRQQQRPRFPPGTWTTYQNLAERCWSANPESRPHMAEVVQQLQVLLEAAGGPFTCACPYVPDADLPSP